MGMGFPLWGCFQHAQQTSCEMPVWACTAFSSQFCGLYLSRELQGTCSLRGLTAEEGSAAPCLKQSVGLEKAICQEQLKICVLARLWGTSWKFYFIFWIHLRQTGMITMAKTHLRKISLSGMQFLSHKKKKPHQKNNLQLFPVVCHTGTCGSQIFHCSEGRKQEGLFICSTVFGTTDLSGYLERQSRASMTLHTYFPQLWICPHCLKLHFFPAGL